MDARQAGILIGGLVIAGVLFLLVDIYLAGIVLILDITLAIAFHIMGETHHLPEVACFLSEDAKKVVLVNRGNDRALAIHVTLVPLDREFDLPELAADGRYEVSLPGMISEAKALVSYENGAGRKFTRTIRLSATGESEEDLLKPVFPIFGWK
ncbi:MAG TPA: hypothetical protein VKO45_00420 [Methanomicrobiales archaeon]|nr:hypothetical protein [Methanomicrobiales archaeon]